MKTNKNYFLGVILTLCFTVSIAQSVSDSPYEKEEICSDMQEGYIQYDPTETIYFDKVLIYSYRYLDREGEFWVYHSTETGSLLYVPEDEMIDFVIADITGTYYFFGTNGHDENVVFSQTAYGVTDVLHLDRSKDLPVSDAYLEFEKLSQTRLVDQSNIQQPNIHSVGYKMTYKKMLGQQNIFITEDIPVNSYLLYGFNRLDGDIRLPVADLSFVEVLGQQQLVTHIERDNLLLKLENYGPNPYFVQALDYTYNVQKEDGTWEKKPLPLLKN